MDASPANNAPESVKELKKPVFKERTALKKFIFIEKQLNYALLRDKIESLGTHTTRQYLYGICSGRLTPSLSFAKVLCDALGVSNVYTFFEPNELYFPAFQTADKLGGKGA